MKDKSMQQGDNPIISSVLSDVQIHRKIQTSPPYINNPAGAFEGWCSDVSDSIERSELNVCVKCSELNVRVQCSELNACIQRSELNVFILVCN